MSSSTTFIAAELSTLTKRMADVVLMGIWWTTLWYANRPIMPGRNGM